MVYSLAYRKHEQDILAGMPPEKYVRLLPHIPLGNILEVGSAEGVLALMLAKRGNRVTALEKSKERHEKAIELYGDWVDHDKWFQRPLFVNGNIAENLDLLEDKDVFVAIRAIYYFGAQLDRIFDEVARKVPIAILAGNKNRANRWRQGIIDQNSNADDYYASREGMRALLERHGYRIVKEVTEGDEIVVGRKALDF